MKIRILSGLLAALALTTTTISCGDDDNFEYTPSNDCIITAATMGSLVRAMHTTDSLGKDSVFYVSVTGAFYPMSIDQERKLIYNVDSLPLGTNINKVTFTALNSLGTLSIKSLYTGNDTIFSMADSTDFSVPRTFTVHSTNGVSKVNYLMTINVHKQDGNTMNWNKVAAATNEIKDLKDTRSFALNGNLYVFGQKDGVSLILKTPANGFANGTNTQWTSNNTQPAIRPLSVVRFNNAFFAVDAENRIVTSTDAINWTATGSEFTANSLVVAGSKHLVALKDGKFYSSTDAINWTADKIDMPELMPESFASGVSIYSKLDKTFESLVVVGVNNGKNVVWKREIDLTGAETYPWLYIPETHASKYNIPNIQQTTLNMYDGVTLMSGLTTDNQLAPLYMSRDNGRTWKTDLITMPEGKAQDALTVTVDEDNYIWMFCGNSGEVWRGRLNRLGWEDTQNSFEKSIH